MFFKSLAETISLEGVVLHSFCEELGVKRKQISGKGKPSFKITKDFLLKETCNCLKAKEMVEFHLEMIDIWFRLKLYPKDKDLSSEKEETLYQKSDHPIDRTLILIVKKDQKDQHTLLFGRLNNPKEEYKELSALRIVYRYKNTLEHIQEGKLSGKKPLYFLFQCRENATTPNPSVFLVPSIEPQFIFTKGTSLLEKKVFASDECNCCKKHGFKWEDALGVAIFNCHFKIDLELENGLRKTSKWILGSKNFASFFKLRIKERKEKEQIKVEFEETKDLLGNMAGPEEEVDPAIKKNKKSNEKIPTCFTLKSLRIQTHQTNFNVNLCGLCRTFLGKGCELFVSDCVPLAHVFHVECMEEMFEKDRSVSCPVCKQPIILI